MASLEETVVCARCGGASTVRHTHRGGSPAYSRSSRCEDCGDHVEMDAPDLPRDLRARFLERDGTWELTAAADLPSTVVRRIASALGLKLGEALARAKTGVLFQGTQEEVAELLSTLDCQSLVLRRAG